MRHKVGRLGFRAEGMWWNCYVALPDSMEDAIPIGSILLRVIEENPEIRERFKTLMTDAFVYTIEQVTGETLDVDVEVPAPEQDRTKPT